MNKRRRKVLQVVLTTLFKLISEKDSETRNKGLEALSDTVEELTDEEQLALDSLPENLQFSLCADQLQDNINTLNDIQDAIDECIDMSKKELKEQYSKIENLINELL